MPCLLPIGRERGSTFGTAVPETNSDSHPIPNSASKVPKAYFDSALDSDRGCLVATRGCGLRKLRQPVGLGRGGGSKHRSHAPPSALVAMLPKCASFIRSPFWSVQKSSSS
jgi:hypothetical protein